MDKVVHFEIPAANVDRARKFYADTFGWQISSVPQMAYHMVSTTEVGPDFRPKEPGAINGGLMERNATIQSPVLVIDVAEIKAAVERVKAAGGKIVRDPLAVGDMGIASYFEDPEGNVLGLWQSLKK